MMVLLEVVDKVDLLVELEPAAVAILLSDFFYAQEEEEENNKVKL